MSAELQRRKAEDQLQRHQSDDANLNLGMRVAAVTVGGVVVGALTAGIGLVPYLAVVGIVAAASGGAVVLQYRRPSDSRLILASEDLSYISQWRAALEEEITKIEMNGKPHLPAGADVNIISHILGMSGAGGLGGWKRVGVIEGMRIMEQKEVVDGYNCRKAQLVVRCSPTNAFIVIMDISSLQWPKNGYIKVANHVDDHVDILEVDYIQRRSRKDPLYKSKNCGFSSFMTFSNRNSELVDHVGMGEAECRSQTTLALGEGDGVRVSGNLSRFWRLDDDGSYIIILTTDDAKSEVASDKNTVPLPQLTAVCTVSPRRDYDQFDEDIPFALISCTIQVQDVSGMWLDKQFLDDFLTDYLTGLLEVRQAINAAKYDSVSSIKELISPDHSEHGLSYWLGPSPSSVSGALDDMPTGIFSDPDVAPRRKLVERGDSGRFDGVATVQPGLDEGAARGAVRSITRVLSASDGMTFA